MDPNTCSKQDEVDEHRSRVVLTINVRSVESINKPGASRANENPGEDRVQEEIGDHENKHHREHNVHPVFEQLCKHGGLVPMSHRDETEAHVVHIAFRDLRESIPVFSDAVCAVLLIAVPEKGPVQAYLCKETEYSVPNLHWQAQIVVSIIECGW